MGSGSSVLGTVDSWLGDLVDRATCAHHQHRLCQQGRHDVRSPRHARTGNAVRVLVDGQEAVTAIAGAKSHVHIADWHASLSLRPAREPETPTIRELLAEVSEQVPVRLPLWAGPIGAGVATRFARCWSEVAGEPLLERTIGSANLNECSARRDSLQGSMRGLLVDG